jgi:hypothetical protein
VVAHRAGGVANKFVRSDNLSQVYSTNTTGKYLQVGNYSNLNSMRLNSFNISSAPYYFSLSNTFSTLPQEEEVPVEREGLVVKDTTAFYFSVGEISVDGEPLTL